MTLFRKDLKATTFLILLVVVVIFQIDDVFSKEREISSKTGLINIDFKAGYLMVSAQEQKFSQVMEAVARETGINIRLTDAADENLTVNFDYLPLEDGFKHLLKGRGYVLVHDTKQSLNFAGYPPLLEVIVIGKLTKNDSKQSQMANSEKLIKKTIQTYEKK